MFSDLPGPGRLVTFDGPNGSGKTTLAQAVAACLAQAGWTAHATRQPSPTPLGDMIRGLERDVRGEALACLVAGDRHHQAVEEIVPQVRSGSVVLCDRYVESSLVLQQADGVSAQFILAINAGIPRPHLRIRLLAQPGVLDARLRERPADEGRRFERTVSRLRELELYEQADEILTQREELPAVVFDTSATTPDELGGEVAKRILLLL